MSPSAWGHDPIPEGTLFHVDAGRGDDIRRVASFLPHEEARAYLTATHAELPGYHCRIYRADREKPLPLKFGHPGSVWRHPTKGSADAGGVLSVGAIRGKPGLLSEAARDAVMREAETIE